MTQIQMGFRIKKLFVLILAVMMVCAIPILHASAETPDQSVSTFSGLQTAISSAPANGDTYVIEITADIALDAMLIIPSGRTIKIISDGNGPWTLEPVTLPTIHFYVSGSLTLENVILDGNGTGGGIQVQDGGLITMGNDAVIQNCWSPTSGGGIYVTNGASLIMGGNAVIKGCSADSTGGGVFIHSSSTAGSRFVLKDNAVIENCEATRGGGVYLSGKATSVTINGGAIRENIASQSSAGSGIGGAIYNFNATLNIDGGVISGNAAEYGGGISAGEYSANVTIAKFTISGGEISGNTATKNGGGLYVGYGVTLNMTGGTVSGNDAFYGGGLYISNFATSTSINPVFNITGGGISENHAEHGGGIFAGTASKITVNGGGIRGNTAAQNGGGVYNFGSTGFEIISGEISGNKATANGGGAYIASSLTLDMTGGSISDNIAEYGGGIFAGASSAITIASGEISGNKATANGGGAYIASTATLGITNGTISGNSAGDEGGGIYTNNFNDYAGLTVSDYQNILIDETTAFTDNTASEAYAPPDIVYEYDNIKYSTTSLKKADNSYLHPINNYDINFVSGAPYVLYYSVAYDANGGTGSHQDSELTDGRTYTVLSEDDTGISRDGFTFNGWNTESDGSGTPYKPGEALTVTSNITLFAQWTEDIAPPEDTDPPESPAPTETTAPPETASPESTASGAKTGDTNSFIWVVLLLISAAVLSVLFLVKRRR